MIYLIAIIPISLFFRGVVHIFIDDTQKLPLPKIFRGTARSKIIDLFFYILFPTLSIYLASIIGDRTLFIIYVFLVGIFIALGLIDWYSYRLPDLLHFMATILIFTLIVLDEIVFMDSIIGLFIASLVGLLIKVVSESILKKPAFGMGDVKLMGVIGMITGIENFLLVFLCGTMMALVYSTSALIFKKMKWYSRIPIGSFLCLAVVVFLYINAAMLVNE